MIPSGQGEIPDRRW